MNPRAVTLPRLIVVRLFWYLGIALIALLALVLHTQFSVVVMLSAIAIYIPLSMLCLPLMAWLCRGRVKDSSADTRVPVWPAYLAATLGVLLVASYHAFADVDVAELGFLLMLVAGDLVLARKEAAFFSRILAT